MPAPANDRRQQLIDLLRDGPLSMTVILKELNIHHPLQLRAEALIRDGVIEQATITPTDLLHATGRMDAWCIDTALGATVYACKLYSLDPGSFAEKTLDLLVAGTDQVTLLAQLVPDLAGASAQITNGDEFHSILLGDN